MTKTSKTEPVAIDIGACQGVFMDSVLMNYPKAIVIGFEPLKANYDYLVTKYQGMKNVSLHRQAVSDRAGRAKLFKKARVRSVFGIPWKREYDFAGNAGSSLKLKSNVSKLVYEEVEVVKLSEWLAQAGIDAVDILKIDSEGSEYDILYDLIQNQLIEKVDKIYFEDHVRKVPGLEERRKAVLSYVDQCGCSDKFWVQDVETGDDLKYIRLVDALKRDFMRLT